MTFNYYDLAYYGAFAVVLTGYALSMRPFKLGGISSFFLFRNATVMYFTLFSVLLGKLVYEGTILRSAHFNQHMYYLMFFYGVVLIAIAALFNMTPQRDVRTTPTRLNIIPLLLILLVKAALLLVDPTPMQELFLHGFSAAHLKQAAWNEPGAGGLVMDFYVYFGPVICIMLVLYFRDARSLLFRLCLLPVLFETSGFYFSKSGLIVPLLVLLIISGAKVRTLAIAAALGVITVFAIRIGDNLVPADLMMAIGERFVDETGYANPQLELYEAKHPPLGYAAKYYLGFRTLFGIEPAVDATHLAYTNETGKTGATSSGHAAVSLYAFWGPAIYVILPALLFFIFYADYLIVRRLSTSYELIAYVFMTFKTINYLTVDIQRFLNFATIFDPTFLISVLGVWFVGKLLQLRMFSAPISFFGTRPAAGTA